MKDGAWRPNCERRWRHWLNWPFSLSPAAVPMVKTQSLCKFILVLFLYLNEWRLGFGGSHCTCKPSVISRCFLYMEQKGQQHLTSPVHIPPADDDDVWLKFSVFMFSCCSLTLLSLCVPVQLPWGCSDESGPQRPPDERPHVVCVGTGQTEAICFPAAGPPQPGQQEGAAPDDDAAGSRQPLVSDLKPGAGESFPLRHTSQVHFWDNFNPLWAVSWSWRMRRVAGWR